MNEGERESAPRNAGSSRDRRHLLAELRRLGASGTATGINGQFAGRTVPIDEAVHTVFRAWYGDLISPVPGKLAYYDGAGRTATTSSSAAGTPAA